jgi:hypothetical protein
MVSECAAESSRQRRRHLESPALGAVPHVDPLRVRSTVAEGSPFDPACADYYERALFNGILGSQHPADGSKLYYVPLGAGYWKLFGTPQHDYWCCTGTMSEQFARLGDAIYFRDDDGINIGRCKVSPSRADVTLVPFCGLFDERYAIYWKVTRDG